jgi:DNA invertase Pin-like site-specific DNA recombinase
MNIAYLRVSTNDQDINNQTHGLKHYAANNGLSKLDLIKDNASSSKPWRTRKIGGLIESLQKGDNLLTPEVSRLARSTLEALEILQAILDKGAVLHITKDSKVIGGNKLEDRIYLTVLGLAAEIERDFIRRRTKESLSSKKAEIRDNGYFVSKSGNKITKLGRPKGKPTKLILDDKKDKVIEYLNLGLNKSSICKLLNVSRPTLDTFINKRIDPDQLEITFND